MLTMAGLHPAACLLYRKTCGASRHCTARRDQMLTQYIELQQYASPAVLVMSAMLYMM